MARITVEGCLDKVESRFELIMTTSKRARQIATGGQEPLVPREDDKPTVIALREMEQGLITTASVQRLEDEMSQSFSADEFF